MVLCLQPQVYTYPQTNTYTYFKIIIQKKKKKEAQALLGDPGLGLVTRGLMLEVQQYSQELVRSWRPLASSHLVAMF